MIDWAGWPLPGYPEVLASWCPCRCLAGLDRGGRQPRPIHSPGYRCGMLGLISGVIIRFSYIYHDSSLLQTFVQLAREPGIGGRARTGRTGWLAGW
jgi:hypothetical protein